MIPRCRHPSSRPRLFWKLFSNRTARRGDDCIPHSSMMGRRVADRLCPARASGTTKPSATRVSPPRTRVQDRCGTGTTYPPCSLPLSRAWCDAARRRYPGIDRALSACAAHARPSQFQAEARTFRDVKSHFSADARSSKTFASRPLRARINWLRASVGLTTNARRRDR